MTWVFFFTDTATTKIYTLSLHDALPILRRCAIRNVRAAAARARRTRRGAGAREDRKSTRLNSSHSSISYAVFCLKKKIDNPGNFGWNVPLRFVMALYLMDAALHQLLVPA